MVRNSTRARVVVLAALLAIAGAACQSAPEVPEGPPVTAITGVRIIDGSGQAPVEGGTILISEDRITAVGANVEVPPGATVVNLDGKTVMPGLINAHGHVQHVSDSVPMRDDLVRRLQMYSNYGVTTVVSLGQQEEDRDAVVALRDEQDGIELDRARVYTSGPSTRAHQSSEAAREAVADLADRGADRIKFHMQGGDNAMSGETVASLIDEAHSRGLRTFSHIFTLAEAKLVVEGGLDVVAHSVRDQDVDEELIEAMRSRNVGYVPTLTRDLSVFTYETTPAFFEDPFFQRGLSVYGEEVTMLSEEDYQQGIRTNEQAQSIKAALTQATRNLKLLSDAGIQIAMGTDSGVRGNPGRWQGYFEHVEIEMMVEAGMTPMQVLVAATSGAAAVSDLDEVGTIAPGMVADLLVLDANPLDDINNTRQINSVWLEGRQVGPSAMN